MALRVPKAELPAELRENMIRQLGAIPEPVEVTYNNPAVAMSSQEFSARVATWDAADTSLKTFAHMAVAAQVGCSWCLDVNYFLAQNHNLDLTKASQVPRWRESDVFTPLERDVMEYAEDVLQESWLRWADVDRPRVRDPRAYLVRTVTRQALTACARCRAAARTTSASGCQSRC